MSVDRAIISAVVLGSNEVFEQLTNKGISKEVLDNGFRADNLQTKYAEQWEWLSLQYAERGRVPDKVLFREKWGQDYKFKRVSAEQLEDYIHYVWKRRKYGQLVDKMQSTAKRGITPDTIDSDIDELVSGLSEIRSSHTTEPRITFLTDIEEERVRWLWLRRLVYGKINIWDGDPEGGKSLVSLDVAARVSTGYPMPGSHKRRQARNVLLVCAEDDAADTIKPRLRAAGADMERVAMHRLQRNPRTGKIVPITIPDGLDELRRDVQEIRAALVIIDPISAYLSDGINSNNDASVRRALSPLADVAQQTGTCVLLIRHLNKSGDSRAIYRGGGSIGFSGAARAVSLFATHPEEDELRVIARVKSNLRKREHVCHTFAVGSWKEDKDIPVIHWRGTIEMSANELLKKPDGRTEKESRNAAKQCIEELLASGPVPAKEAEQRLGAEGHARSTWKRAKSEMGIRSQKIVDDKGKFVRWDWRKPTTEEELAVFTKP